MNTMTILIADDDPVIRKLFEKRLTNAGYQVRVAVDGMDAAQQLHTSCFDIIITDLVMPGDIGGLELLQIAKQRHPRTEVIVITAHSSIDTAVNAMKNGAVDYLEKPINFDELFLRLDKIAEVNSLVKNAGDLREAMDVTESMAAKTIQNLEITAGDLQLKIDRLETILCDASRDQQDRIDEALDVIQR